MATVEAEPVKTPPSNGKKRPEKPPRGQPKVLTFFERLADIPKADWGTRATIKLYRLEPVINRLATSDNKYIGVYAEPVNEERVKVDYGSGKYRLYLNYKLPAEAEGKELDSVEFDIMDMAYPPKIPLGEWVDAPKNKDWAWAKPLLTASQAAPPVPAVPIAAPHQDFAETIRALNEVQNSAVERAMAATPVPMNPLELIRVMKDIMPTPAPSTENAVLTTVVTLFTTQLNAAQAQTAQLFKELSEMRTAQLSQPKTNGLDIVKELVTQAKALLPDLKEFFPASEVRARGPWWSGIAETAIAAAGPAVVPLVQQWAMRQQQNGAPAPHDIQNGAPGIAAPTARPQSNGGPPIDLDAMLLSTLSSDPPGDGEDMAYGLCTFFGQDGKLAYQSACALGEHGLLQLLQGRPIWNQLGGLQQRMPEFIHEFMEYGKPAADSEPVEATAEVIS